MHVQSRLLLAARGPTHTVGCLDKNVVDAPAALGFLPGQYVNVRVPGTDQKRAYSFSCGPGRASGPTPTPIRGTWRG